ncbi:hypothetical protein GGR50DRAFT_663708 [Xylaria sp. CBS 124048]|nr:hypothetical protein GGR50DRAFT_663708 [Xylaria sp. CBS 124048]
MFPTFSGSSRRPRNIDLSGQRNTNPWANSAWTPSGPSRTVAQAQAERERRHREREELAATKRLQRVWRGYIGRQQLRDLRRQEYDDLCDFEVSTFDVDRQCEWVQEALLLLLAFFEPTEPADHKRLDQFLSFLWTYQCGRPALISDHRWSRLARLLVSALENRDECSRPFLSTVVYVVEQRPASIKPVLENYYRSLARVAANYKHINPSGEQDALLSKAITAPLTSDLNSCTANLAAYETLAYAFLTSSKLHLLQRNAAGIAGILHPGALSKGIINSFSDNCLPLDLTDLYDHLFLLAHYIALNRAASTTQDPNYIKSMYLQLAGLSNEIHPQDEDDEHSSDDVKVIRLNPFPEYVVTQLESLVDEDGIGDIIGRFASLDTNNGRHDLSMLAGYTLLLLQYFPTHADDIKMRLFHGNVQSVDDRHNSPLPIVKFLWTAASKTSIFKMVLQTVDSPKERPASISNLLDTDPEDILDSEWRIVILFLELYNFLLRVTDDEDFMPRETEIATQQSPTTRRVRASGLNLEEVKLLLEFLKHMAFPLYYDYIIDDLKSSKKPSQWFIDAMMGLASTRNLREGRPPYFAGITDMSFVHLRSLLTSTMHALYERDSRRKFLPQDFWLMPARVHTNSFVMAVGLQQSLIESVGDDGEDDEEDRVSNLPSDSSEGWFLQGRNRRWLKEYRLDDYRSVVQPKLAVLQNMPFVIPFEDRVRIFRQLVQKDKLKRRAGHVDPDRWRLAIMSGADGPDGPNISRRQFLGRHTAIVSRERIFEDAFQQFYPLGEGLKEPIQITFIDQFNQPEAGIDGGGVTKEFLISFTNNAFGPERMFFVSNDQNLLYPNPSILDDRAEQLRSHGFTEGSSEWNEDMNDIMKRYEFLGRVVGKCLYEGILIDISFAGFFLLKWMSSGQSTPTDYRANLNDLHDLDPGLYQGLMKLKNYPGDVADFCLDFTIADSVWDPSGHRRTVTRPLRKDGANIPVTNKDRPLYISYVANHRLVGQQYRQTRAFLRGLGTIIDPSWLSMFNQSELQRLIGGDNSEIDVEDLRTNTMYSGVYAIGDDGQEHPTIEMFWDVMRQLKDSERRAVLKYVTSTPRAPLLGFSQLKPQFSIRDGGNDNERLPSTSTCVNLLKLPVYKSIETLRAKLLYAVNSGAGFDLS